MSRKQYIKDTIEQFITSNHKERLAQCTFGVEIETQYNDDDEFWSTVFNNLEREDYMDTESYYNDLRERVTRYIDCSRLSELIPHRLYDLNTPTPTVRVVAKDVWNRVTPASCSDLSKLYTPLIRERVKAIEDRIDDPTDNDIKVRIFNKVFKGLLDPIDCAYELDERFDYQLEENEQECMNDNEYYYDEDSIRRDHPDLFRSEEGLDISNNDVEVVNDQSVSGSELRTIGGLEYDDFETAVKDICAAVLNSNHYVDKNCSAHIHIKLGSINHYYGDGHLHNAIMEYLVFNLNRLPERVQRRLRYGGNRWIKPYMDDNKYRWVNFHDQKTIEFRLFGGIDRASDIMQCLKIALEALAYGYQVRFGDYKRALSNDDLIELAQEI